MKHPTLAALLEPHAVSPAQLAARYAGDRALVRFLLGTVPHADAYLALWEPAMRAQGLLVPGMLDLPGALFRVGGRLPRVGLAMFAASDAASCGYCTAHSCSFAARRGFQPESLRRVLGGEGSPIETGVATLAAGMARPGGSIDRDALEALRAGLGARETEWIALAAGVMGYLNTCMDGLGVALEASIHADVAPFLAEDWRAPAVRADVGRPLPMEVDTLGGRLALVRHAPGALLRSQRWMWRVPSSVAGVRRFLERNAGYRFPLVGAIGVRSVRRRLATVLRDHLVHDRGVRGAIARSVGERLGSPGLRAIGGALAEAPTADVRVRYAVAVCDAPGDVDGALAQELVATCGPSETVAVLSWVGVLRLLERLERFYGPAASAASA